MEEKVAFITNNKKDFGEGPYIAKDLQEEISNKERLIVYGDLEAFNETHIIPKLILWGVFYDLALNCFDLFLDSFFNYLFLLCVVCSFFMGTFPGLYQTKVKKQRKWLQMTFYSPTNSLAI